VRLINKRISLVRLQILTTSHLRTLDRVYISINSGSDLAPHSLINKRCSDGDATYNYITGGTAGTGAGRGAVRGSTQGLPDAAAERVERVFGDARPVRCQVAGRDSAAGVRVGADDADGQQEPLELGERGCGIPAYVIEIKRGNAHQLTLLTVNKQKLYAVTASADEKRWGKREKLLRNVVDSFQPKL